MKSIVSLGLISAVLISLASFRNAPAIRPSTTSTLPVMVADTVKIDAETGLANDANLMMVKSQCLACHSSKLILQHRFTRAGWQERIRWMQTYHKLWALGESEKVVLDYLEKHYGPQTAANVQPRRAPLKNINWYKLD